MRTSLWLLSLICLGIIAGCAGDETVTVVIETMQVTEEPTAQISTDTAPAARPSPQEPQITTLVIWLPDLIYPAENTDTVELLDTQLREFTSAEQNLQIEIRRKHAQDVGGILSTLRTASTVAPGALPDITLLRRDDLLTAAQSNLLQPLEGRITTGIISGLNPHAVDLGSINNELYGMPYMLEALLVAYQQNAAPEVSPGWTFETVLENRLKFAFTGGRSSGISDVFYVQYLAAGGTPPQDGVMDLSEQALLTTLIFYEKAREVGLIDSTVLNYANMLDYEPFLIDGSVDAGVVNSSAFNRLAVASSQIQPAFIPTSDGIPTTLLNGWMWVIVTDNADRQAQAGRLINWMMDSSRQGQYASLTGMLPSQIDALRTNPFSGIDSSLMTIMLQNAVIPLAENEAGTVVRIMQNALAAVLNGDSTAEEATRDAVNQLSG